MVLRLLEERDRAEEKVGYYGERIVLKAQGFGLNTQEVFFFDDVWKFVKN